MKNKTLEKLAIGLSGTVAPLVLSGYLRTCRWETHNGETWQRVNEAGPYLFACLHGRLILPVWYHRRDGITAVVSRSSDGEMITRVITSWGYGALRGSSSRGQTGALRGMISAVQQTPVAVTVDGPRGPRLEPKMGVIAASRATGRPILPISGSPSACWQFSSWDRFTLPKPFSRVIIGYAEPLTVPKEARGEAELEEYRLELKRRLVAIHEETDALAGGAAEL